MTLFKKLVGIGSALVLGLAASVFPVRAIDQAKPGENAGSGAAAAASQPAWPAPTTITSYSANMAQRYKIKAYNSLSYNVPRGTICH